jgi:NAD(P)-dependent dehydrogenase (short-subunit alcohol dehydrogenase family)
MGYQEPRVQTEDGLPRVFAVNVLSFYVLTALVQRPKRLVYLSSGMHRGADASLDDVEWTKRRWRGAAAYAESKLCDVLLAFAVARRWPRVFSNAVDPGWVPTRMGGPGAPDDLEDGYRTQVWLAVSDDPAVRSCPGSTSTTSDRRNPIRRPTMSPGRRSCSRSAGASPVSRSTRGPDRRGQASARRKNKT